MDTITVNKDYTDGVYGYDTILYELENPEIWMVCGMKNAVYAGTYGHLYRVSKCLS